MAVYVSSINLGRGGKQKNDGRIQVPVNVAVEEPRAGVVREEADRDIVTGVADAHDVPNHGIVEVVRGIASATEHVEGVSVQVNGMLYKRYSSSGDTIRRHASA